MVRLSTKSKNNRSGCHFGKHKIYVAGGSDGTEYFDKVWELEF
jgi:hypothetical protein